MCLVQHVAKPLGKALIPMPLLTELVLAGDGFNYRHAAPDGALFASLPLSGFALIPFTPAPALTAPNASSSSSMPCVGLAACATLPPGPAPDALRLCFLRYRMTHGLSSCSTCCSPRPAVCPAGANGRGQERRDQDVRYGRERDRVVSWTTLVRQFALQGLCWFRIHLDQAALPATWPSA